MDVIGAIGAINAVIIAFFLYKKKDKSINDKLLMAWVCLFALHFSMPFFIERKLFFHEFYWGFIFGVIIITHMPFLFVYTQSLVQKNFRFSIGNLWHFVFVIVFILTLLPAFMLGKDAYLELIHGKHDITYQVFIPMITFLFCQVYFLIRTIISLLRHQYTIKTEFSYNKAIDLTWIKRIVYGFASILLLYFLSFALVSLKLISLLVMDYIILVVNMLLFFYTAYSGYNQKIIFTPEVLKSNPQNENSRQKASIEDSTQTEIKNGYESAGNASKLKELLDLMEHQKPYLEQELTIGQLALELQMHVHQLSKMLNEDLNKNFFEFVNEYRVSEFKELATDPKNKNISILGLAFDAGFSSKSTFNRFFKSTTGITPSAYMESCKAANSDPQS